jgi:predicted porin
VRLGYAAGPLNVSVATGKTTNGTGGADYTHNGFGGSFAMGAARVMAQYNKMSGTIGGRGATNWLIGGAVTMGATDFRASYQKTDGKGDTGWNKDATQIAAGAIHNLSKRTALYGTFSRISNSNNGAFSHSGQRPAVAGGKSTAYEAGVRHNF